MKYKFFCLFYDLKNKAKRPFFKAAQRQKWTPTCFDFYIFLKTKKRYIEQKRVKKIFSNSKKKICHEEVRLKSK